jgi:ABC-type glycerol-3-phosphate transport system substrate-binding protein
VIRRATLLLVALLALAGCGGDEEATPESGAPTVTAAAAAAGVEELANVLELRSDFEADAGKTRVIVLFSPT